MRMVIFAALLIATPASAKIAAADGHGFALHHVVDVAVPPARAWAALVRVQDWWSKDHTYSGNAARLSLEPRPGGCFCERLDGGGAFEHMRVARVQPGERLVLAGSLGPLLYEATTGVMDVTIAKTPGGTRITLDYRVAGFGRDNGSDLAPKVDAMIGEQVRRLAVAAARPARR